MNILEKKLHHPDHFSWNGPQTDRKVEREDTFQASGVSQFNNIHIMIKNYIESVQLLSAVYRTDSLSDRQKHYFPADFGKQKVAR